MVPGSNPCASKVIQLFSCNGKHYSISKEDLVLCRRIVIVLPGCKSIRMPGAKIPTQPVLGEALNVSSNYSVAALNPNNIFKV